MAARDHQEDFWIQLSAAADKRNSLPKFGTPKNASALPANAGEGVSWVFHFRARPAHIRAGIVTYAGEQGNQSLAVHWGYAQVEKNRVTILAELAESAEDIDAERARNAETRAKEELSQINLSADDWESEKRRLDKYELKLKRSLVRQQASSLK